MAVDKAKYGLPFVDPTPIHVDNEKYPIGSRWSLQCDGGQIIPVSVKETTLEYDYSKRERINYIRLSYCGKRPEMKHYEVHQTEEWLSDKLIKVRKGGKK